MTSFRDFDTDKGRNWVHARGPYVHGGIHGYLRFEPHGGDMYELYVLDEWRLKASMQYFTSSSALNV